MNQDTAITSAVKRGEHQHRAIYAIHPSRTANCDYHLRVSPAPSTSYTVIDWTHNEAMCQLVVREHAPFDLWVDIGDDIDLSFVERLSPTVTHGTDVRLEAAVDRLALVEGSTQAGAGSGWDTGSDLLSDFFCLQIHEGHLKEVEHDSL